MNSPQLRPKKLPLQKSRESVALKKHMLEQVRSSYESNASLPSIGPYLEHSVSFLQRSIEDKDQFDAVKVSLNTSTDTRAKCSERFSSLQLKSKQKLMESSMRPSNM